MGATLLQIGHELLGTIIQYAEAGIASLSAEQKAAILSASTTLTQSLQTQIEAEASALLSKTDVTNQLVDAVAAQIPSQH